MIQAIFAMQPNGIMGNTKLGGNHNLPWPRVGIDMNHYKDVTKDAHLIMGSATYESTPKQRHAISHVITLRAQDYRNSYEPNVYFWETIQDCLAYLLNQHDGANIFVVGGAQMLHSMLPYIQKIHLNIIHTDFEGDIYAPNLLNYGFKSSGMVESSIDPATRTRVDFYELTRM